MLNQPINLKPPCTQNGTGCYCGDAYNKDRALGCYNEAMVRCPGDDLEVCGGRDGAVAVYRGKLKLLSTEVV